MRRMMASGLIAALGVAGASLGSVEPAYAQATGCEQMQKLLAERQGIVAQLNSTAKTKQKMTPAEACGRLGRLVSNGNSTIKFATANQDWCQIPPTFVEGLKADNDKATGIRNQACNAVKQQAAMQRKAQQQAQQGGGANPFGGGDAITGGTMRIPQGAL